MNHPIVMKTVSESLIKMLGLAGLAVMAQGYDVKQVTDGKVFCESIWGLGLKIMLDPVIVSKDHTKFTLVVPEEGELHQYLPDQEKK